jgi:hypothetical protein
MCGATILADEDRLYDPRDSQDRPLLGFKSTISEYELILMHNRLERNRLHKARRCALFLDVPCGYLWKAQEGRRGVCGQPRQAKFAGDPTGRVAPSVELVDALEPLDSLLTPRPLGLESGRFQVRLGRRWRQGRFDRR